MLSSYAYETKYINQIFRHIRHLMTDEIIHHFMTVNIKCIL